MSGAESREILDALTDQSSFSDYYSAFKKLQKSGPGEGDRVKVAILGSYNIDPLSPVLDVFIRRLKMAPEIMTGGFNQYAQEILNPSGALYSFKPDMALLFLDAESLFGAYYHFPYRYSADERKHEVERHAKSLGSLVAQMRKQLKSIIVLNTLEVPFNTSMGIMEGKVEYGFSEMIRAFNRSLFSIAAGDANSYVFDLDNWAAHHGKSSVYDAKMKHIGQLRISTQFYPDLARHYMRYIKALKGLSRKCIVLDMDNTLWGGVVGEDGPGGIQLGNQAPGSAFVEFQRALLNFYERGILLAINSKNEPEAVWEVIDKHPNMILRREHFAAARINWQDKATNMREIAKELNIGLSSFVFFDDNPAERFLVRKELPEVCVPELPPDPVAYSSILNSLGEFELLQISEEDMKRSIFYSQKKQADDLQSKFTDMGDFLKELQMKCIIEAPNSYNIQRIAQLTQKTNQFNLTTRRYSLEEVKSMAASIGFMVNAYTVVDRFGDQGIVGVTIVRKEPQSWMIDTFLLSCRVLKRQVEQVMLGTILSKALEHNVPKVYAEYLPTEKNVIVKDFYRENGFSIVSSKDGAEKLFYDTRNDYALPEFIKRESK